VSTTARHGGLVSHLLSAAVFFVLTAPQTGLGQETRRFAVVVEHRLPALDSSHPTAGAWVAPRSQRPVASRPIPWARVFGLDRDGRPIATGVTDADGVVALPWSTDPPIQRVLVTALPTAQAPFRVDDCTRPPCAVSSTWAWEQAVADVLRVPVASPAAAALSIRSVLVDAASYIERTLGDPSPAIDVHWQPNDATRCETSCVQRASPGRPQQMFLLGLDGDSDEFDRSVILHEFAHALEGAYGIASSPGGWHDGTPTHPSLAFSEGIASAFALLVDSTTLYVDTFREGGAWMDYAVNENRGGGADPMSVAPISEDLVAEVVLDLAHALGDAAVLRAWLHGIPLLTSRRGATSEVRLGHLLRSAACDTERSATTDERLQRVLAARDLAWKPPACDATTSPTDRRGAGGGRSQSPITPWRVRFPVPTSAHLAAEIEVRTPFASLRGAVRCEEGGYAASSEDAHTWRSSEPEDRRTVEAPHVCTRPRLYASGALANGSIYFLTAEPSASSHGVPWRATVAAIVGKHPVRVDRE
jgi:hypothetical protein